MHHHVVRRQTRHLSTQATTALVLVGVPTGVYLYKCLMMVMFQSKLIYLPYIPLGSRHEERTPDMSLGMDIKDVEVVASDRKRLRGMVVNPSVPPKGPVMIYFQGNAGNMNHRLPLFQQLVSSVPDMTIVGVCYRGFGSSLGRPSEKGLQRDAQAILRWTLRQYAGRPIFLYGHSLGGSVASYLASTDKHQHIQGVILENTYLSILDMVKELYTKWTPYPYIARYLLWNRWPTKQCIAQIACPVLFLSSARDEIVPPEHMQTLYRICKNHASHPSTRLVTMPRSMHMDMYLADRTLYKSSISDFIHEINHGKNTSGKHQG